MPLSDMQLVGLIQLVIEQERHLLLVRAHLIALEQVTIELAGHDMQDKLAQYTRKYWHRLNSTLLAKQLKHLSS